MVEEVCPICFRFLASIYDKKRMKNIRVLSADVTNKTCNSLYHKKLTDGLKS